MRYLLLSDIHANLHALEAVLADAKSAGYDETLVLGDLVGYGGDPEGVIDRTLALEPTALIRGNHDKVAAGLESSEAFNDIARQSIEWTARTLSPGALKTLRELPKGPHKVTDLIEISHGAPFDEDYYVFDAEDAARALDAAGTRWAFFGHTHLPALFATSDDPFKRAAGSRDDDLILPVTGRALVNVGSVGQPRDGDPRAAYGIVDTKSGVLSLRRVTYDVIGAQRRILDAGLPSYLAIRLERGQ